MVGVCLVLAPDVKFILNSRKQDFPYWRRIFFFLSMTATAFFRGTLLMRIQESANNPPIINGVHCHVQTNRVTYSGSQMSTPATCRFGVWTSVEGGLQSA